MRLKNYVESGVIKTFRTYVGVRLVLCVITLLIYLLGNGKSELYNWQFIVFMLLDVVFLFAYLSIPGIKMCLNRFYLPIGIVWATVGPITQLYYFYYLSLFVSPDRSLFLFILQDILVIFIPLVITGWQYSLREVILFCVLTFLSDGIYTFSITFLPTQPLSRNYIFPVVLGTGFVRTILFFFIGNMITNLMNVQREQQKQLVDANKQLIQYSDTVEQLAITRERNRVARELHDVMAHTMSGVAVELEGVKAMLRVDTDQAEMLLEQSLKAVREGLGETRRALQALRASPLEEMGLGLAIQKLAEATTSRTGLPIDVHIDGEIPNYSNEVQQVFYRVAQEAITNAVTHGKPGRVLVNLRQEGKKLILLVQDDGIGFDEKAIDSENKYGLIGIRERAAMIHGEISIVSRIGVGTKVFLIYTKSSEKVNL